MLVYRTAGHQDWGIITVTVYVLCCRLNETESLITVTVYVLCCRLNETESLITVTVYVLCCRLNETESLINSHLYTPRCIKVVTPLPSVCQCGDDDVVACDNENSLYDRSQPTVTYLTNMVDTCVHSGPSRWVCPFRTGSVWYPLHLLRPPRTLCNARRLSISLFFCLFDC